MSEAAQPADAGPMSVDQAIASLLPAEPAQAEQSEVASQDDAPQEAAPEAVTEQDTEAEASPAEEPAGEAENPPDEEREEPAQAAENQLDPPLYWKPEAKEAFAKLDPALQAEILAQEGPREESASKAKQEAAQVRERADQEIQTVAKIVEGLNQFLPDAIQRFQSKWADVDWVAFTEQHGVEAATRARFEMEQEQANLTQIAQAKQQAEVVEHQAFLRAEEAKLSDTPLASPEERQKVGKYLSDAGIPQQALLKVSAAELTIAHKAMLWDQSQALLKAKPPAPKPAAPARPLAKPQATSTQSPAMRTATAAIDRFNRAPTVDNAVAMLLAKKA